jgi:hypothetical protein
VLVVDEAHNLVRVYVCVCVYACVCSTLDGLALVLHKVVAVSQRY